MRTTSFKDDIYIGKKAGVDILNAIKNAKKSVKVVSPYLSPAYILELVKLSKEGKNITLITSDNLINQRDKHSGLKASDFVRADKILDENLKQKRRIGILFSLMMVLILFISLPMSFFISFLLYPLIILFFASIVSLFCFYLVKPYKIVYKPLFRIRVFHSKSKDKPWSTELVHSKIFVIDDCICFLGSANFTFSGFEAHYETVIRVEDINAIRDISLEVERLYNSDEFRVRGVEEWGFI